MVTEEKKDIIVQLMQLWEIQETLLQWYRAIFIAAIAILFTSAINLISNNINPFIFFVIVIISIMGIILAFFWMIICHFRAEAVTFVNWLLLMLELNKFNKVETNFLESKPLAVFKSFQSPKRFIKSEFNVDELPQIFRRSTVQNNVIFISLSNSKTRLKLDKYLPIFFILFLLAVPAYILIFNYPF